MIAVETRDDRVDTLGFMHDFYTNLVEGSTVQESFVAGVQRYFTHRCHSSVMLALNNGCCCVVPSWCMSPHKWSYVRDGRVGPRVVSRARHLLRGRTHQRAPRVVLIVRVYGGHMIHTLTDHVLFFRPATYMEQRSHGTPTHRPSFVLLTCIGRTARIGQSIRVRA